MFLVLKSKSGGGKSTFLNTLDMFYDSIEITSIDPEMSLNERFKNINPTRKSFRIIILEKRESFDQIKTSVLEAELHAINNFERNTK